jgi:hypothetical protein
MSELCHIFKGSNSCPYVMILPCILVMRQQHILSFLCIYFKPTSLLASTRVSEFSFMACYLPIDLHHQHRPAADVSHLISVPPGFSEPS